MCSEKLQVFKFSQNLGRASGRLFQKIGIFQINPNTERGEKITSACAAKNYKFLNLVKIWAEPPAAFFKNLEFSRSILM
jgi:hypothetical protein